MPHNYDKETPSLTPENNELKLGAKILSQVHFESHQPIVESSFQKAKERGERLPGKNNERRNYSYLSRIQKLIDKHGNALEKRLWQKSINNDLLIKEESITEATWDSTRQEYRNNGYGSIELTDELKHEHFMEWRRLQKESLERWANYLGDEHSPYPIWFKVYAWDGMTKMGLYDKAKGQYQTRNESTVAPYPQPDAEILAKVFEVVNRYHGNNEKQFYTEEGERNIELERIIQTGNFPKIFNAIQQDIAPIIEPPERTEDVHGEWVEYQLGDEDNLARAASGTGWCISSSSVGNHYLKYGTYGDDDESSYYEDYDGEGNNKARFILFHLMDSETGKLARNACASIRLNPNGEVAEISGLKPGQALDDSLVPIVKEKVLSLPDGERFLGAFEDKQKLIALDRKMTKGEDLSKEELEFIYGINREIKTLDTYNKYDPRIRELKKKYNIKYALNAGINVNQLVSKMYPDSIAKNLDALIKHGANIDINQLVSEMYPDSIAKNLDTLIKHGANIDINQLVSEMYPDDIAKNLDTLINHSVDINQLVSEMNSFYIAKNLDTLINHSADINQLVSKMYSEGIAKNLDALINHSADINQLVSKMHPEDIAKNLDTLIKHGANIDINQLVSKMNSFYIATNLDTLINHSADINQLVSEMYPEGIAKNLDTLIKHGANIDINQLVSEMRPFCIAENLDTLIKHGANPDQLGLHI